MNGDRITKAPGVDGEAYGRLEHLRADGDSEGREVDLKENKVKIYQAQSLTAAARCHGLFPPFPFN